jgi:hypothetical protein
MFWDCFTVLLNKRCIQKVYKSEIGNTINNDKHVEYLPPYYKMWSKVSLGLKLMLSLLFAKGMTVTASTLKLG